MTGVHVPLLGSDLYGVAYLAGGPRRAVEAAVVALIEDGRLRVTPATAELHVVDPRRRHPVEAAVLDAAGPRAPVDRRGRLAGAHGRPPGRARRRAAGGPGLRSG